MIWRGMELVLTSVLLGLSLPVMALAALAIVLSGGGPVLFLQTRAGQGGRPFRILKLRSMTVVNGQRRVTRVGRVLRAIHIDELPQLFNVLAGDMALVGPRPERLSGAIRLARAIPGYRDRLAVRPGITGLAQIRLPHGTSLSSERIKARLDRDYLSRRSVRLDLAILAMTPVVVLFGYPSDPLPAPMAEPEVAGHRVRGASTVAGRA